MMVAIIQLPILLLVATVPTACGIETLKYFCFYATISKLQQYLPLAVLKLFLGMKRAVKNLLVATVPTACGIETY